MIEISKNAVKRLQEIRKEEKASFESYLRVRVKFGGCSGFSYKMEFDLKKEDQDRVFENHGVKVIVDPQSLIYILGMRLDYEGGLNGKGFQFSNPNAKSTCGCGSSFAV